MTFPTPTTVGQTWTEGGITYRLDIVSPPVWTRTNAPPVYGVAAITEFDPTLYRVSGVGVNSPPAHVGGNRYVIGSSPTGAWAGQAQMIAESDGSVWAFEEPVSGQHVFNPATDLVHTYNGLTWSVGTTTNTITNTVALSNGDYGDVLVSNNGTTIAIKPGVVSSADLGLLNDLSPTQIANLQGQLGTGSGVGSATQTWYDPAGFATISAGQSFVFPFGIALPSIPAVSRLSLGVQNLGQPFRADLLALQVSLNDGTTWLDDVIDGAGSIATGSRTIPFDRGDGTEQFLTIETTPRSDAHGLAYSVVIGSETTGIDAGPMRLKLISRAGASQIKWTTLSIG